MSSFVVSSGLNLVKSLPTAQVVIVCRQSLLPNVTFDGLAGKLTGVDRSLFQAAVTRLESPGSMPIYLNLAKIVTVSDEFSRHNSPSNAYAIFSEMKSLSIAKGIKDLSVVLYTEYANALAGVTAIARAFPLFSRKTSGGNNNKMKLENIEVEVVVTDGKILTEADLGLLQALCENIRNACRLIDTPCNELHSEAFAEEAIACVDKLGVPIEKTLIKGEDLQKRGFGGIYSVGVAAAHPPVFLCLSYKPSGEASESIALVGKGIVFDTGGLSIKGKTAMPSMKIDMGGAAIVLATFCTLVKANFKQNLHCLLCIAENAVSPMATRPDDIITLLSGKTAEISNTDAEGRLVLADGVFYAMKELKATMIIDCATLTGAQAYATGRCHAAILTNSEELELDCVKAGQQSGNLVHALPFAPELHFGDLKSHVADMKNANLSGKTDGPPTAIAGLFIGAQIDFGKGIKWLHVDLAALTANNERATGFGPALFCTLLSEHIDDAGVSKFKKP